MQISFASDASHRITANIPDVLMKRSALFNNDVAVVLLGCHTGRMELS